MSLETWKAEYYPVPAGQCPREQAVEHSLRKWIGLRAANLERHGCQLVTRRGRRVTDGGQDDVVIDSSSCSLCVHYCQSLWVCPECPLQLVLGMRCDSTGRPLACGWGQSPYRRWIYNVDPEPMIAALEAALRLEAAEHQDAGAGRV